MKRKCQNSYLKQKMDSRLIFGSIAARNVELSDRGSFFIFWLTIFFWLLLIGLFFICSRLTNCWFRIDQPVVENDQKILGFERQIKFIEEMTLSLLSQVEQLKNGQLGFIDHQGDIFVGSLPFIKNNEAQRQIHNAYGKTNGTHEHIKQLFDVLIADLQVNPQNPKNRKSEKN